ncbi:MAG: hypothetical protein JWQ38_2479 [Flavipsychrobacter sp.]|nr:hypothetical protein [Flavipsychrobacter sp.]
MIKRVAHIGLLSIALFLCSCKDTPSKNHGPIILGDSATIVTETDPKKLEDLVADLKPEIPPAVNTDTVAVAKTAAPDTSKKEKVVAAAPVAASQPQLPAGQGLLADFKDVSVLVTGLVARQAGNPNLQRANGAVYTLTSGNIPNAQIKIRGTVTKVSQRYKTVVLLKSSDLGTIQIDAFSTTTDWEALKGVNNQYKVTGLDAGSLDYPDANATTIRNAVTKAAKRRRMSRAKVEDLLDDVRKVKSLSQKPMAVVLRSVMWKIDGKDAQGKNFSKQIRVDIPL